MQRKGVLGSAMVLLLCVMVLPGYAQYGIFDKTADWGGENFPPQRGSIKIPGSVTFANGVYTLQGNGDDIWDNNDEGFFVYTEKSGSWSLSGKVQWIDPGPNDWAKIGVMVRENGADPRSRHYWIDLRGASMGDRVDVQWRDTAGAASGNIQVFGPDGTTAVAANADGTLWIRVTRLAESNLVMTEYSTDGVTWETADLRSFPFQATVAYGLAISNHDDNDWLAEGTVSDVKLEQVKAAPILATRSVEGAKYGVFYKAGADLSVKIELNNTGADQPASITETVPTGWTISDISNGGTASANKITWNLTAPAGVSTLSYKLKAAANATGTVAFSGKANGVNIGGATSLANESALGPGYGIFAASMDVDGGNLGAPGSVEYDAAAKKYMITGSGHDIWDAADDFHFLFMEVSGGFSLKARIYLNVDNGEPTWAKAGPMVRDNLSAGSAHGFAMIRAGGQDFAPQWRDTQGGPGAWTDTLIVGGMDNTNVQDGLVEIERIGKTVNFYYYTADTLTRTLSLSHVVPDLNDPVYAGLAVTSHSAGNTSMGEFTEVEFTEYTATGERIVSSQALPKGGGKIPGVKISVSVGPGKTYTGPVVEQLPAGLTASNLVASTGTASFAGGKITWNLSNLTGSAELSYDIDVTANAAKSVQMLDGYVTLAGGKQLTLGGVNMLVPIFWSAPYIDRAATLDGLITPGEYDGAYKEQFGHADGDTTPPGVHITGTAYPVNDENVTFYVYHNQEYIYCAMDVVDPVLDFDSATASYPADVWRNDSTELYIDGNLNRQSTKENGRFGFQATVQGDGARTQGNDPPTPVQSADKKYYYSSNGLYWNYGARVKEDQKGYVVEYAVTKAQVLDPPNRTVIGFDILMNGGELTGDRSEKWGYWTTRLDGTPGEYWNDETGWAIIELVGAPSVGVTDWSLF